MQAPRPPLTRHGQPQGCRYCGEALDGPGLSPGGHCSKPACVTRARVEEGARLAREKAEREAAWTVTAQQRTRPALEQAASGLGLDPDRVAHGLVPHAFATTEPVDPQRRAAFVAHLDRLIERAFADPAPEPDPLRSFEPEDHADFARRDQQTDAAGTPVDAACIACQGLCCFGARHDHGFLTDRTLAYARHRRPDATAEDLRAAYLDNLPERSVLNSCIYHDAQGCTQDRELRSDICNAFECGARFRLEQAHRDAGGGPLIAVGLVADHHESPEAGAIGLRVVSHSDKGFTVHEGLALPPLPPDRE